MGKEVQVADKNMSYEANGKTVELTPKMVMNYIAKGNVNVSVEEAVSFMKLCQYQELNPFLNEAYLVKYSTSKPADMIVSKEAYMKKAEMHPLYEGYTAGLILLRDKKMVEVQGSFKMPSDELLGSWCIVHRKDRKNEIISKVVFKEYSTGQSTWNKMPCTMIRKVAIVQAHREAFPNLLGGMYIAEEVGYDENDDVIDDTSSKENEDKANNGPEISFDKENVEDIVYKHKKGDESPEATYEDAKETKPVEKNAGKWEPTPEELEEIRLKELEESGKYVVEEPDF